MTIGMLGLSPVEQRVALERLIAANRTAIDAIVRATGNNVYNQFITGAWLGTDYRVWPKLYSQIVVVGQGAAATQAAAFFTEYVSITSSTAVALPALEPAAWAVTSESISAVSMPKRYGKLVNQGVARAVALDTAGRYGSELAAGDVQWAQRVAGEQFTAETHRRSGPAEQPINGWHKIPSGAPCGWCITVSDQLYSSADSIPMHNGCRCGVAPATDGDGFQPNQLDDDQRAELLADPAAPAAASIAPVEHGGVVAIEELPDPF